MSFFNEEPEFSTDNVEASSSEFSPIPPGIYKVAINAVDERQTKAGNGCYLSIDFVILSGPRADWHIWHNCNLKNPNEKAQEIGREQLKRICDAVGVTVNKQNGFTPLVGTRLTITTKWGKEYNGEKQTEIKNFEHYSSGETAVAATPAAVDGADEPPF